MAKVNSEFWNFSERDLVGGVDWLIRDYPKVTLCPERVNMNKVKCKWPLNVACY